MAWHSCRKCWLDQWTYCEISYLVIFVPQSLQLLLSSQVPEVQPHPICVYLAEVQPNLHKGKIPNRIGFSTHRSCNLLQVCSLMVGHQFHLCCLQEGCFPWDINDFSLTELIAKQTCIVKAKYEDKIFILLREVPIQATQQSIHDSHLWKIIGLHQNLKITWVETVDSALNWMNNMRGSSHQAHYVFFKTQSLLCEAAAAAGLRSTWQKLQPHVCSSVFTKQQQPTTQQSWVFCRLAPDTPSILLQDDVDGVITTHFQRL